MVSPQGTWVAAPTPTLSRTATALSSSRIWGHSLHVKLATKFELHPKKLDLLSQVRWGKRVLLLCKPWLQGGSTHRHCTKLRKKGEWTHLAATLKPICHDSTNASLPAAERAQRCVSVTWLTSPLISEFRHDECTCLWGVIMLTYVSGPTTGWVSPWPVSPHKPKAKSACAYWKHLSRKPNIQTNNSALGGKQG